MNKKKKIIVVLFCVCVISTIAIFVYKTITVKRKIENDIVLLLNDGIESEYIKEKNDFVYGLKNPTEEELDISLLIKEYIENIEKCIKSKISNETIIFNEFKDFKPNIDLYAYFDTYGKSIVDLITEDDINKYKNGIFIDYIVKELENKLVHKLNDEYAGWYIKNDNNKTIELPYNVYIEFKANDIKKLGNDIKILNVKLCEKDISNKLIRSQVRYMMDNVVKDVELWFGIEKDENTKKTIYSIPGFWSIYYNYSNSLEASAKLGQHDYDAYMEKWMEENDSSHDELPHYEFSDEELGYHSEWKKVFNGDGKVGLFHYFEDDRWEYRFRMAKPKKNGVITGFHLPYTEEMTMDEAVERFLNDEEQVKKAKALWD